MHKQNKGTPPFRLIILLMLAVGLTLVSCTGSGRTKLQELTLAPLSEMPDYVQEAAPEVQEAYQFAVANPESLEHIPCYCGCNAMGHRNNADCYVKSFNPDGTVAEFDNHAAYWGICVDITRDVMQMTSEGKETADIRAFIDQKYSQYGPPTETDPVPAGQFSMAGPPLPGSTEPAGMAPENVPGACGESMSCQGNYE